MRIILLSGGAGKRLWPLSNPVRAKQFLQVLPDGKSGRESMLQRVWAQLQAAGLRETAVLATSRSQADLVLRQLGETVKIVPEPEQRDTYPAIALAAAYLFSEEQAGLQEVVVVLPVDLLAEGAFFRKIKALEQALLDSEAELGLLGVRPAYPSEKFGYIVPAGLQKDLSFIKVASFREKPPAASAGELIRQGALWNCGVFAFRLDFLLGKLREAGLPADYPGLKKKYAALPKTSFDYHIAEKSGSVIAVLYPGKWKDLGSWSALAEELPSPVIGRGFLSPDTHNTHLINELNIPVIALGLSNAVIAAGPDGILVADKDSDSEIKEQADLFIPRPMYEERRWGWYRVLDYTRYAGGQEAVTKRIHVAAGKNLSYQVHFRRNEVWSIVQGEGEAVVDKVIRKVRPGDVLQIPAGVRHSIKADTDLEFIEVQTGESLREEEIARITFDWEEVKDYCPV
ncbi:MAG: sugar phosphate nucleotidyltransferase [Clostridia bacterium]|jgi:mannose-1-phosphate guanylyltransferase|nr:sugar phosphate nucleotidyltransferase [Clostridia bacterium]